MALLETQSPRMNNQVANIDETGNREDVFTVLANRFKTSDDQLVKIEKYLDQAHEALHEMKSTAETRLPKKWNQMEYETTTRDLHLQFHHMCMLVPIYISLASMNRKCRSYLEMARNCMDDSHAHISGSGESEATRVLSQNGMVNRLGKLQDDKKRDIKAHRKTWLDLCRDRIHVQEKVTSNLINFLIQLIFSRIACISLVIMILFVIVLILSVPIETLGVFWTVLFGESLFVLQFTKHDYAYNSPGMVMVIIAMFPFLSGKGSGVWHLILDTAVNLTSRYSQLSPIDNSLVIDKHPDVGELGIWYAVGQLIFFSFVMSVCLAYVIINKNVFNIARDIKRNILLHFPIIYSMIMSVLSITYQLYSDLNEAIWVTMFIAFTIIIWFECSGWFTKLELVILVAVYLSYIDTANIFGIIVLAFITLFLWIQLVAYLLGIIDI